MKKDCFICFRVPISKYIIILVLSTHLENIFFCITLNHHNKINVSKFASNLTHIHTLYSAYNVN